jgi:hypothetical protein
VNNSEFQLKSYISAVAKPDDFKDAIHEVVQYLPDEKFTLALSGGVDSLSIACALIENDVPFNAVTFDLGPKEQGNTERSQMLAEELGFEYETIQCNRPPIAAESEPLEAALRTDIYEVSNERYGVLVSRNEINNRILSGQSLDTLYNGIMSEPSPDIKNPSIFQIQKPQYVFNNILLSDFYRCHPLIRKYFIPTILKIMQQSEVEIRDGKYYIGNKTVESGWNNDNIYYGILSSNLPNLIRRAPLIGVLASHKDLIYQNLDVGFLMREVDLLREFLTGPLDASSKSMKSVLYYSHAQNHFKTPTNHRRGWPSMEYIFAWGPCFSYFLDKSLPARTVLNPKKEIHDFVDQFLSTSYKQMTRGMDDFGIDAKPKKFPLLKKYKHLFDPSNSLVVQFSKGPKQDVIYSIYDTLHSNIGDGFVSGRSEFRFYTHMLNLELLLSENAFNQDTTK